MTKQTSGAVAMGHCPVCTPATPGERDRCFLCCGTGAVPSQLIARWVAVGRPMTRAAAHDD